MTRANESCCIVVRGGGSRGRRSGWVVGMGGCRWGGSWIFEVEAGGWLGGIDSVGGIKGWGLEVVVES